MRRLTGNDECAPRSNLGPVTIKDWHSLSLWQQDPEVSGRSLSCPSQFDWPAIEANRKLRIAVVVIFQRGVVTLKGRCCRLSFWKQDALNVQDGLTQPVAVYLAPPIAPHQVYGPLAALPLDCRLINLESLSDGHAPVQIVADDPLAAPLPFAFDALRTNPKPHPALDAVGVLKLIGSSWSF